MMKVILEAILPAATDEVHHNVHVRFFGDKDAGIRWIPLKQNPAYEPRDQLKDEINLTDLVY